MVCSVIPCHEAVVGLSRNQEVATQSGGMALVLVGMASSPPPNFITRLCKNMLDQYRGGGCGFSC